MDTLSGSRCKSQDTKNLNLDKHFEEILSKMKQMGWSEEAKTAQDEGEDQQAPQP